MDNMTDAAKTVDLAATVHQFEYAKLGKAPYQYLGIQRACASCEFCNTPISYKFYLKGADGKVFFVGSDCIEKSGDAGLIRVIDADVKRLQKEVRDTRADALIALFAAALPNFFSDDKRPHPYKYRADRGETYGDYLREQYNYRWLGKAKKASMARKFLLEAGVPLPDRRKADKAEREAAKTAPKTATVTLYSSMYQGLRVIEIN